MNILITGGTGLIGQHLIPALREQGHTLALWARRPNKAQRLFGDIHAEKALSQLLPADSIDAVINLAGEGIADRPWTKSRQRTLRNSRIALSKELKMWFDEAGHKPTLLTGSAVGIYGHGGGSIVDENTAISEETADFPAALCKDWESVFAEWEHDTRVVYLRTGLVLSKRGGLLKKLLPSFSFGLGAQLGNGEQYMPWIHWSDYVRALLHVLHSPNLSGPVNLTAPKPVNNSEFTKSLANALSRPTFISAPAWALKLGLGQLSQLMLEGQNAVPKRLVDSGFEFEFTDLDKALAALK